MCGNIQWNGKWWVRSYTWKWTRTSTAHLYPLLTISISGWRAIVSPEKSHLGSAIHSATLCTTLINDGWNHYYVPCKRQRRVTPLHSKLCLSWGAGSRLHSPPVFFTDLKTSVYLLGIVVLCNKVTPLHQSYTKVTPTKLHFHPFHFLWGPCWWKLHFPVGCVSHNWDGT